MKKYIYCETQDGKKHKVKYVKIRTRISAYGILLNNNNEVLVLQAHLPLWEFPGGGKESRETLRDALVREFREETGLVITPKSLLLKRESYYLSPSKKVYHSFQHFFVVDYVSGKLNSSLNNLCNAKWLNFGRLTDKNMNKGAYTALQILKKTKP